MRSSFMIGCLVVLALFMFQFVASTKAQQVAAPTPKLLEYKVVASPALVLGEKRNIRRR